MITTEFTLGALSILIALGGMLVTIMSTLRKNRRENEADNAAATRKMEDLMREKHEENRSLLSELKNTLGDRVTRLEALTGDFVPRREIESKFEHERTNRLSVSEVTTRLIERANGEITDLKVRFGGLSQRQDGHDAQLSELKAIVREGFEKQADKIDRLSETLRDARA